MTSGGKVSLKDNVHIKTVPLVTDIMQNETVAINKDKLKEDARKGRFVNNSFMSKTEKRREAVSPPVWSHPLGYEPHHLNIKSLTY